MNVLAHYKKSHARQPGLIAGLMIIALLSQFISLGLMLWSHETWMIALGVFTAICFLSNIIIYGLSYLLARWNYPAVWVQNDTLYAVSPLHFRMRMDDVVSWRVTRRYAGVNRHLFVALKNRKGKERYLGLGFIDDHNRLLDYMAHLFGPQTQITTPDAIAKTGT